MNGVPSARRACALALTILSFAVAAAVHAAEEQERPLKAARISIAGVGSGARVAFSAAWRGPVAAMPDPTFDGATLRIGGAPGEPGTGLVRLLPGAWAPLPKGKGWKYDDPAQAAGGIRSIVLETRKRGGSLRIAGGGARWPMALTPAPTSLAVTLQIGDLTFCAEFRKPRVKGGRLKAAAGAAPKTCPCDRFDGTWAAIQKQIFERRGCTAAACHGGAVAGGLDLRPESAYASLVRVASPAHGTLRVVPGGKQDSFLWQKLAAARGEWTLTGGSNSPMPLGQDPLGADELDAIGRWIHDGAREDGVVAGTEQLLGSCLPPVEPPAIVPPAPPAAGTGVQFVAAPWSVQPRGTPAPAPFRYGGNGEDEVCYATYYDLLRGTPASIPPAKVIDCPEYWQTPTNVDPATGTAKCFAFDRQELTQEPNSHHSIIHLYRGQFAVSWRDPAGLRDFDFRCHAGETPGDPCDPQVAGGCPAGQVCRGAVRSSLACLTFGPPDMSDVAAVQGAGSANSPSVGGSQQPYLRRDFPEGVFGVLPVRGVIVWNSHAFNAWDRPVQNSQWWNIWYVDPADPAETRFPAEGIFDAADIFVQSVPPFEEREYCRTITFGKGTRLFELSSHTHRFGRLFRVFPPPVASSCRSMRDDPATCTPESTPPILVTTQYNDPAQVRVAPDAPFHALDSDDPAQRRFKFCAVFDNGKTDPATVKRNSTSPVPPTFGSFAPGGPCRFTLGGQVQDGGIACLAGPKRGQLCGGDDRACDSAPGAGDGVCDACPLEGGVTTEDEMFILLGTYYCDTTDPAETCTGVCAAGPREGQACHGNHAECPGAAGACRPNGTCRGGMRNTQACTTDADCWQRCAPYAN